MEGPFTMPRLEKLYGIDLVLARHGGQRHSDRIKHQCEQVVKVVVGSRSRRTAQWMSMGPHRWKARRPVFKASVRWEDVEEIVCPRRRAKLQQEPCGCKSSTQGMLYCRWTQGSDPKRGQRPVTNPNRFMASGCAHGSRDSQ